MTIVDSAVGEIAEALDEAAAERLTERIRLIAENVAEQMEKLATLIDAARVGSAWLAMGYRSWPAYVAGEFSGVLPRLDREPRQDFVRELASRGMSTRAIAPVVGASVATVARDVSGVSHETPDQSPQGEAEVESASGFPASPSSAELTVVGTSPRPAVLGLDGKRYTPPARPDHASLADAAVAEFPELAYYRDEAPDLEHCWRLAEKLREYRSRDELDERRRYLSRAIEVARSKRDGTYQPPTVVATCPTCGQTVKD